MNHQVNQNLIKTLNQVRLLNLIKNLGPISRSDLARESGISKVAVSDIVNRLNENGFILEIGKGESTRRGGKRPTLLKLNPDNGFVIGMEIQRRHTTLMLANIESDIRDQETIHYPAGTPSAQVIKLLFDKIDELIERNDIPADKLVAIGIGIPGFIDYENGSLLFADTMEGWKNLPLVRLFSERYQVPAIIENDVNTITLGESLYGTGGEQSNVICIWIGEGIGSGILIDGKLIRGVSGSAGEIGYLECRHFIDRHKCHKINTDHRYVGDILSEKNLLDALQNELLNGSSVSSEDEEKELLSTYLQLGDHGNEAVRQVLAEYASFLTIICTTFIKTLNPALILLSGRVISQSGYLLDSVRNQVRDRMQDLDLSSTSIVVGQLGEEAGVRGAIHLALQTIFDYPLTQNTTRSGFAL